MHIKLTILAAAATIAASLATGHAAARTATVTLEGDWLLQAGQITSDTDLVAVSYQLGTPVNGRAVFEPWISGGIAEAPTGDAAGHYSRQTWVFDTPTQAFTFSGLDLDQIGQSDDVLDVTGASMSGAYIELTWSDGFYKLLPVNATPWDVTQVLTWSDAYPVSPVPEPGTSSLLLSGMAAIALISRRTAAKAVAA
jgi:hypothetical protein